MKQFRSLNRAIRRGHIKAQVNPLTGFLELYGKTSTSKKHTVYITSFEIGGK